MEKELKPIFGTRPIKEALSSGEIFDKVFVQKGLNTDIIRDIKNICNKKGFTLKYVPQEKLDRLTKSNHQGIFGFISPIKFHYLETLLQNILDSNKIPFALILDSITDVRNFGAIVRTAECVGINMIIIPKEGTASINGDTIKTSAGAIFNIPICKVKNLTDATLLLRQSGMKIISSTEKTDNMVFDLDIKKEDSVGIVFGSEEKGISNQILKLSNERAKLPIKGTIKSLNVSVAVGAFCYEVLRKKL